MQETKQHQEVLEVKLAAVQGDVLETKSDTQHAFKVSCSCVYCPAIAVSCIAVIFAHMQGIALMDMLSTSESAVL